MKAAKIQFSPEELSLVRNADWILTKNAIIRKISTLFADMAAVMQAELAGTALPAAALQTNPKISRGENYKGLPYVILDYPRLFTRDDVFAIRVLFWWGHYFSVTLHLKGIYKNLFLASVRKNIALPEAHGFFIGISDDEWAHALHEDDYLPIGKAGPQMLENIFNKGSFLKISVKLNLDQWNEAGELLPEEYRRLVRVMI